jgi:hypothetical protein
MKKKDKISIKFLESLENELSKLKIDNTTSVGQLLPMSLYQGIYCGDYFNKTLLKKIKIKLALVLFNYKNNKSKIENFNYSKNIDGLITFTYNRADLIYLDTIVTKYFIDHQKKIQPIFFDQGILESKSLVAGLSTNDFCILNISDILSFYNPEWFEKYKPIIELTEEILVKKLKDYKIYSDFLMDNLKFDLRTQIFHYSSWLKFLKIIKPSFIIVESDRNNLSSPVVMASKKLNIASFSLMHGNVGYDFGYVPILASQLLVWGKQQKKYLIKAGAHEDQIKVVGAPQFSEDINLNKKSVLKELSIQTDKKIIVLATSNYKKISTRLKLIKIFAEALKVLSKDNWHGVIKMHPRDDSDLYSDYSECEYLLILSSDKISKEASFAIADYFCFFSSAIAFEALLKKKKLILIMVDNKDIGECRSFIEKESVPVVINSNQLIKTINDGYSIKMQNKLETFSKDYFFASGKKSLKNVYSHVNNYIKNKI